MILFRKTTNHKEFFIIDNDIMVRDTTLSIDFRGDDHEADVIKWYQIKGDTHKSNIKNNLKKLSPKQSSRMESEYQKKLTEINDKKPEPTTTE